MKQTKPHPRPSAHHLRSSAANIKAVAFDGYGTVINFTEPDFIGAMAEICGGQGLAADAAGVWKRFIKASYRVRAENHHEPVYQRYDAAWAIQFEIVFGQLGLDGDPLAASAHLKRRLAEAPAFDEAHPAIDALRRHFSVALLSNADDDFLTACLDRNRLKFDSVVSSERAHAIKPDPEIFHYLAREMGLRADEILYVGDNPIPDVLGPKRAGMPAVWLNRTGARRPRKIPAPEYRLRSLGELVSLLVPGHE